MLFYVIHCGDNVIFIICYIYTEIHCFDLYTDTVFSYHTAEKNVIHFVIIDC